MIFQIFLSLFFILLAFYFHRQKDFRKARFVIPIYFICIGGLILAWFPEITMEVAHFLGIGRGADLVLYFSLLGALLISINVHFKFQDTSDQITKLTRKLAILESDLKPDKLEKK